MNHKEIILLPLHEPTSCTIRDYAIIKHLVGAVDMYCVDCKDQRTFSLSDHERRRGAEEFDIQFKGIEESYWNSKVSSDDFIVVRMHCGHRPQDLNNFNLSHSAVFVFSVSNGKITKIGESPSRADRDNPEYNKFRPVIGDQIKELKTASGLYSHGIGAGSFVYLRRIFERLVNDAADEKALKEGNWDISKWKSQRMVDKLKELSEYMPEFLNQNRSIYGLLSKGVHEMSDKECLTYFNVMKNSIELILDQRLAQIEIDKKQQELSQAISQIRSNTQS